MHRPPLCICQIRNQICATNKQSAHVVSVYTCAIVTMRAYKHTHTRNCKQLPSSIDGRVYVCYAFMCRVSKRLPLYCTFLSAERNKPLPTVYHDMPKSHEYAVSLSISIFISFRLRWPLGQSGMAVNRFWDICSVLIDARDFFFSHRQAKTKQIEVFKC